MRKYLLLLLLGTFPLATLAQAPLYNAIIDFDDTSGLGMVEVLPGGQWEIGEPVKTIFNGAYTGNRAMVSDTADTYTPGDTSVFIIHTRAGNGYFFGYWGGMKAYYNMHSDTLSDYGTFEFSPDNGMTWIDLLNDPTYDAYIQWQGAKPVFTGNSVGWQSFRVNVAPLATHLGVAVNDSIAYRFTFISDNINTGKDGWMLDHILLEDQVESVGSHEEKKWMVIAPNPAANEVQVTGPNQQGNWRLTDLGGRTMMQGEMEGQKIISTAHLGNGVYLLYYTTNNHTETHRLVIGH